jgi:hypothetical protein
MTIITYKFTTKGGSGKFFRKIIIILRISNLQQSLALKTGIADITLKKKLSESRKYGGKFINSLG